jgi:DNA-directed RNA polymerase subunit RPC12/RpoP
MESQNKYRCLSCGADISGKRSDAKYCSARCWMRYRQEQQKMELIQKLADLFTSLPNHSVQFTGSGFYLLYWDALSGKTIKWNISDLQSMSNRKLKSLIKQKRWLLAGNGILQRFFNSG